MESLLFISTTLLVVCSFFLLVGIVFSSDEFDKRNEWRVIQKNRIDWKKVDAGKFLFFVLSRAWVAIFGAFIIAYIGVRYV